MVSFGNGNKVNSGQIGGKAANNQPHTQLILINIPEMNNQPHTQFILINIPSVILDSSIKLNCGKKPEHPEKTYTRRAHKLHRKVP